MKIMLKPKRVLCKKGFSLGDDFQYIGFTRVKLDNRWLIEGQWYDVVYNPNDSDNTFSIINHQGNRELFFMYDSDDENLTRTYAKWFYTIQEMREMKLEELLCV